MNAAQRLKAARERAGYDSAAEAAVALGVSPSTYSQHENGIRGFKSRAEAYARRLGTTPEWLLFGRSTGPISQAPIPVSRMVPILGNVQAGLFAPVADSDGGDYDMVPLVMPDFQGASLYALRVVGDSMNRHYPDGTLVIVCPSAEIGIRDGDHVVVRRHRDGMAETTVKEVVQERGGVALWPRSTSPDHQTPTRITRDHDADSGHEIIGVVVSSYVVRPIQRKPTLKI